MPQEKGKTLEFGRGSTKSYSMENWLWKRPWICRTTDAMNEFAAAFMHNVTAIRKFSFG